MTKVRKNVSIDAHLAEIVDERDEFNLSGFVNRCLEQHFAEAGASSPEKAVIQAKLEAIEEDIESKAGEIEQLRQKKQECEQQLEQQQDQEPELLSQAKETLKDTPREPTNPAIQSWASKVGMTPEHLLEELPEREKKL